MMRRLEELDRLDAHARSAEEVLWPSGTSSRQDPRAWTPSTPRRHRSRRPWWEGRAGLALVVAAGIVATVVIGPSRILAVLPARAERPVGAEIPSRSDEASSERVLPVVAPPAGVDDSSYAWMQTQPDGTDPVRFDPCRPIHYVTRSTVAATQDPAIVHEAVAAVSASSGIRFVDDGSTDEVPTTGRKPFQPDAYGDRWAPVLIGWTDARESPELEGHAGLGGGIPWRDTTGRVSYVSGTVWLDAASLAPLLADPAGRDRVRAVVMHELTHVLGATHVDDPAQLMSVDGNGRTDFGLGDLHALSVLGSGECVPGL